MSGFQLCLMFAAGISAFMLPVYAWMVGVRRDIDAGRDGAE